MRALVLEKLHEPLVLKDLPQPEPKAGEVCVHLKAAALNRRDVWIQQGQYAAIQLPAILGSDGAGIVSVVGEGVDTSWKGREVIINPGLDWGSNPKAQGRAFRVLGMPDAGTFAESVIVPVFQLALKPKHLSWNQAAALPLAGATAYRALITRANIQPGEKVLITGIGGGVAVQAMQFALAKGAEVYVTSSSDDKIQRAIQLGARGGVNYRQSDWAKNLKSQAKAFDVIIDSAAGDEFAKLTELATEGGRIAMYGGTQGVMNGIVPGRIFWKQLSILGSTMGTDEDFRNMIQLVEAQRIVPVVSKTVALSQANEAFQYMKEASQFGKIVLEIS